MSLFCPFCAHASIGQPSLSVYPEAVTQEPGLSELSIKKERVEHGAWHASAESSHGSSDLFCRAKRGVSSSGGKSFLTMILIYLF